MRNPRYQTIADDLRRRLDEGEIGEGRLLPSESALVTMYAASRTTVRRALDQLRDLGLVDVRQGYGWFVRADPLRQSLGRLGTVEAQLAAQGRVPARRVLDFAFVDPPPRARTVLGDGQVLRVRRLNLADGIPFARITVWCPEDLGAALSRDDVEGQPFYELLGVPLGGAVQTIGAAAASAEDAALLQIPTGAPVLVCERVTTDADGRPVLLSEQVFASELTEFVVDLPHVEPSIAATGVRLVGAVGDAVPDSAPMDDGSGA